MLELIRDYGQAYLYSDGYKLTGLAITLWLTVLGAVGGLVGAIPLSIALLSTRKPIAWPAKSFSFALRGTPLYVQILLLYVGVYSLPFVRETSWLNNIFRDGFRCAAIAIALNSAAYAAEIFAGAMRRTPRGEIEAALACGMSARQTLWRVIWPGAWRRAIPAYSNEVVFVLHATALASAVTVKDVMSIARAVNADTYKSFEAFGIAAVIYLCTTFLLLAAFRRLEQRMGVHLRVPNAQASVLAKASPTPTPEMKQP